MKEIGFIEKIACIFILSGSILISCNSEHPLEKASLEATSEMVSFSVGTNSSQFIKSLSVFTDSLGNDYLTFQSNEYPEIYVYDMKDQKLVKTIIYQREGADGIGPKAAGYMMKDWNEIYVPNLYKPEISVIDSSGHKLQVLDLTRWNQDYSPVPTRSVVGNPFVIHQGNLYCMQLPNPYKLNRDDMMSPTDISVCLDGDGGVKSLPMAYPRKIADCFGKPSLGIEQGMSRCFNGEDFVYSFAFDENIYIFSPKNGEVRKKEIKSRYIEDLKFPDHIPNDFNLAVKMMCELPFYSHLVYDEFRQLYYRFVFPRMDLNNDENFAELWQSGRNQFSVMILDKELNVLGETLLPENHYRSNLFYITEKGLYISESHYKNPSFNDDSLIFRLFVVSEL